MPSNKSALVVCVLFFVITVSFIVDHCVVGHEPPHAVPPRPQHLIPSTSPDKLPVQVVAQVEAETVEKSRGSMGVLKDIRPPFSYIENRRNTGNRQTVVVSQIVTDLCIFSVYGTPVGILGKDVELDSTGQYIIMQSISYKIHNPSYRAFTDY